MSRFLLKKPVAAAPTVLYDALGGGYKGTSTAPSWSHTVGSSANALVVCVTSSSYQPNSMTFNGVAMTNQTASTQSTVNYLGTTYYVNIFTLLNPATGSHSVSVAMAGSGYFAMNSVSYKNVTGFGTAVGVASTGGGTTAVVSATGVLTNQILAAGYLSPNTSSAFSGPSGGGSSRWNYGYSGGVNYPAAFGDIPGVGTSTTSITETSPGAYWCAAGLPIL